MSSQTGKRVIVRKIIYDRNFTDFTSNVSVYLTGKHSSAVLESTVYWHDGGSIKGSPQTPQCDRAYSPGGFKGALNWTPKLPRGVSFSNSYTSVVFLFWTRIKSYVRNRNIMIDIPRNYSDYDIKLLNIQLYNIWSMLTTH